MKTQPNQYKTARAYALVITLVFVTVGVLAVTGAINWAQTSATLSARNSEYITTLCAAESAIEKVRARVVYDYVNQGEPRVYSSLNSYSQTVPTVADNPQWGDYSFTDPTQPGIAATLVRKSGTNIPCAQPAPYEGLTSYASKYQIIANVQNTNSTYKIPVCVGAELVLGQVPLFQFAIFYQEDMEINPGQPMAVYGLLHGNADIYLSSSSSAGLTLWDSVSASGNINVNATKPGDSGTRGNNVQFKASRLSNQPQLNLPIGTNQIGAGNVNDNVHAVLDVPPAGEPYAYNQIGTNRYYNKADLILLVNDTNVVAKSGVWLGNSVNLTNFNFPAVVNTNVTFHDNREGKDIVTTTLDIGELKKWSETNTEMRGNSTPLGNQDISTLFVADQRTNIVRTYVITTSSTKPGSGSYIGAITTNGSGSNKTYTYTNSQMATNIVEHAIVLTNGAVLPNLGLTLATPLPVYIKGNYNVTTNINTPQVLGSTNTANTRPASILCDAITILSSNWKDTLSISGGTLSGKSKAAATTVNAAFLTGNVPTAVGLGYSGGVENFPRFLEDWTSVTFTYNGSMVAMFASQVGVGRWGQNEVYAAPTRKWTFDNNFMSSGHLPPNSPYVMAVSRGQWKILPLGSTNF